MQSNEAHFGVMQQIETSKVIAIARGIHEKAWLPSVKALVAGGVHIIELTTDTPGALRMIERVAEAGLEKVRIGAGTVLQPSMVRDAVAAGAEFILTPMFDEAVIEEAMRLSCPIFPGVMTPSEIFAAGQAGAVAVKLFPASILGPRFVQEVRAPLPSTRLIPTGGIDPKNAVSYLQAGAFALGVGSWLLPGQALEEANFDVVTERARALVRAIAHFRE